MSACEQQEEIAVKFFSAQVDKLVSVHEHQAETADTNRHGPPQRLGGAAAFACSSWNEGVAQMQERPWTLVQGAQVTTDKATGFFGAGPSSVPLLLNPLVPLWRSSQRTETSHREDLRGQIRTLAAACLRLVC